MGRIFDEIYEIVKRIPKGKVATYGQISSFLNKEMKKLRNEERKNISPRVVGFALHKNPDPKNIPCHRVVNKKGRLAPNFAFDGWGQQRRKLLVEGVKFKDKLHVDLEKHIWRPR